MFTKPVDGRLLRLVAFFALNPVFPDPFDSDEFLNACGSLMSQKSTILVVEKLFVFDKAEKRRAAFATADDFDRSEPDELFDDLSSIRIAEFIAGFGVADLPTYQDNRRG